MPKKPPKTPHEIFGLGKAFGVPPPFDPQEEPIADSPQSADDTPEGPPRRQLLLDRELEQKIEQRRKYAGDIFVLISIYLVAVFILLVLAGADDNGFTLSNSVLMVILGTTTTTVLGLFYVIVRHLFPPERTESPKPSPTKTPPNPPDNNI